MIRIMPSTEIVFSMENIKRGVCASRAILTTIKYMIQHYSSEDPLEKKFL